jgi:lipid-binding SYLF domain-containing protein
MVPPNWLIQVPLKKEIVMEKRSFLLHIPAALACMMLAATVSAQGPTPPKEQTPADYRKEVAKNTQDIIARYKKTDPGIERFFKDSAGYAVFPRVGKAGFIFAAGHGDGEVYEKGKVIGTASITLATVGLTAGAQEYSEIIFFENSAALDRFKQNKFEFAASASAVILKSGVAKDKKYSDGVAVFVQPTGGAMAEAALGTQKFSFKPEGGAPAKK